MNMASNFMSSHLDVNKQIHMKCADRKYDRMMYTQRCQYLSLEKKAFVLHCLM